ncbi:hypothetical protein SGQ83_20020 [Flavobacterium sp. Fl-318]|uniref:Entry exclusion lipoprotein TrbK n=1 Tax=Flavobacterium cupriresistens TaxID=2893885 RepID=A0ABU4RGE9_9FLAO|nr:MULTISPECIES: hypothetical protein [unclassified Flavobacterium]MDX6191652.1 hypothetical protein [Flavobacterium sp. Fl-318]UFH41596.1 hypothetical protein LNP23_17485 [Flavobacterium sp. F-323]
MRIKFYLLGLVFASLSMASCSNDDLENEQVKNLKTQKDAFARELDSSSIKREIAPTNCDGEHYGDPSNPKPPRH